jgi:hypothetical protein
VLKNDEDVKKKWKEYFVILLKEEYLKEFLENILWNEGLIGLREYEDSEKIDEK